MIVLGGLFTTIPSGADANDYKKSGKYYIGQGITNLPTLEEPVRCILIVEEKSDYVTQTLYDVVYAHNRVFQRCCDYNTWSSWAEISTNIPSFYKNYNDLSALANALGVNFYSVITNPDDYKDDFDTWVKSDNCPSERLIFVNMSAGWVSTLIGFKNSSVQAQFIKFGGFSAFEKYELSNGTGTWSTI